MGSRRSPRCVADAAPGGQACTDDVTVVEDQGGGAVVLLLVEGEVLQHVPDRLRQGGVILPGRGHEGDDGLHRAEAVVEDAALQGLVETARVTLPGGTHDGAVPGGGEGVVVDAVLAVGVELAVVRHQAERLRHGGVRFGVGGEPGVEVQGAHTVPGVDQVTEVGDDLIRVEPALEYLGAGGQ